MILVFFTFYVFSRSFVTGKGQIFHKYLYSHDAIQNLDLDETNTLILFLKVRMDDTDNIDLKSHFNLM